ncbi:putative conserved membrane protein [Synechococcus sp. MIT S9220]|uniref:hypothetical protein n=1 Tax=unclassified Synechococcus TaxID=2626047 RepID=UPI00164AF757|nr:hypothetical protein [Synechococcus sp. MIT S9220]NOL46241.1 hypothetical protein [Synechococcus sp. MIT S9220]QNJ23671.1 putative conserved membrane protein [Synechococcus sp. MIT S9220]
MGQSPRHYEETVRVFPIQLTRWIEGQPDLSYLVKAANDTQALYTTSTNELNIAPLKEDVVNRRFESKRAKIRDFFWPTARSMRGDCYGTKSFDDSCNRAANTMAGSTLWDAVSTVPFVQFALINILGPVAMPAAIGASLGLMVFSNGCGKTGANRAKGKSFIANCGLAGFIFLSVAKTAASGIGFDILVNKEGIAKEFAAQTLQEQIQKRQDKLSELQTLSNPKLINLQNSCEPLQNKIRTTSKELQPQTYETLYVQAYGTYAQKTSLIGLTNNQILEKYGGVSGIPGVCNRADAQLAIDLKQADKLQEIIATTNSKIGTLPAVNMLQEEFPKVFKDKFKLNDDDTVEIRSGQDVVSQATLQFWEKLNDPSRISEIGTSLFWMAISVILSFFATLFLWGLSLTKEMKMSYNTRLLRYRMELLQSYQENLPLALKQQRERRAQETRSTGEQQ